MPITGTPEAPFDHQAAHLSYRCPHCGREERRTVSVRIPLAQLSLAALQGGLQGAAGQTGPPCPCGGGEATGALQAASLEYRFLQGTDSLRLEADVRKGKVYTVRHVKVSSLGKRQDLGAPLDEEGMLLAFGRPLSVRAAWDFFLRRTLERREGQIMTFPGFAMATAPPGPRMAAILQSNAELARMTVGEDALVVALREVDELAVLPEGSYHEWLSPRMAQAAARGQVGAVVVVRPGAVVDRFGLALAPYEIRWKHAGLTRIRVDRDGLFFIIASSEWLTWDILMRGFSIDETAAIRAALADAELRGMDAHRQRLMDEFSGWQVAVDERVDASKARDCCYLRIRHPGGHAFWVNLSTMWRKAQDPAAFVAHVEQIRGILERRPEQLDRCACGRPAYVTKKWKPLEWLTRAQRSGTRLISEPSLGHAAVFARDCAYHSMYLADATEGLSIDQLEQRFEEDLNRHVFTADYELVSGSPSVPAVALWGTNIASIALHPALVAGVLASMGLGWEGRVRFRAASTNAIALAAGAAEGRLLAAAELAARRAAQRMGDPGDALGIEADVELGVPAGRFERLRPAA